LGGKRTLSLEHLVRADWALLDDAGVPKAQKFELLVDPFVSERGQTVATPRFHQSDDGQETRQNDPLRP